MPPRRDRVDCGLARAGGVDVDAIRIFWYDLWWPPLLLWIVVCLIASAFAEARIERWSHRILGGAAVVIAMAAYAESRPAFSDPEAAQIWKLVLFLLPVMWGFATWIALPQRFLEATMSRRVSKVAVSLAAGGLGALFVVLVRVDAQSLDAGGFSGVFAVLAQSANERLRAPGVPPAVALAWPLLMGLVRFGSVWNYLRVRVVPPVGGVRQLSLLLCIAAITACLAELFYVAVVSPAIPLTAFLAAWVWLTELLFPGILTRTWHDLLNGTREQSSLRAPERHRCWNRLFSSKPSRRKGNP